MICCNWIWESIGNNYGFDIILVLFLFLYKMYSLSILINILQLPTSTLERNSKQNATPSDTTSRLATQHHNVPLSETTWRYVTQRYVTWRDVTLRDVTLRYATWRNVTQRDATWRDVKRGEATQVSGLHRNWNIESERTDIDRTQIAIFSYIGPYCTDSKSNWKNTLKHEWFMDDEGT